jgi:hypothetical protein
MLKLRNRSHAKVPGWQKSMCLAAVEEVAMASCQTLACALDVMGLRALQLTAGGMVCCRLRRGWICFCTVPING